MEESVCVELSHVCSKREFRRVGVAAPNQRQIQNYDYRKALHDFQDPQNIRSMSMEDVDDEDL